MFMRTALSALDIAHRISFSDCLVFHLGRSITCALACVAPPVAECQGERVLNAIVSLGIKGATDMLGRCKMYEDEANE